DAVERTPSRGISLSGFLCEWALMTSLDPAKSLANLIYLGHNCDATSAIHITRRRSVDRKKQQTERNVFQCFVFGPKNSGKSAMLASFLGRRFSENHTPPEQYASNVVKNGSKKTLILREIPEDGVKKLLSDKESLAACDVSVFVYDSSDSDSFHRAIELLSNVARLGEETVYGMPCLLIAAKYDLNSKPVNIKDAAEEICLDMNVDAPVPMSAKEGNPDDVFLKIVEAAEHPHRSIPETQAGRDGKRNRRRVYNGLLSISVGAAAAFIGLAAYRVYYASRKNSN
ncbi:hypothetical protein M569_06990, partial [Genlisea aurea]